MASTPKKSTLKLDRLNERATADFVPVTGSETSESLSLMPLSAITARPGGDTRSLNQQHINALAESISILGLITPLTVDQKGRLLAGGHRQAALQKILDEQPELFSELFADGIPVRVMDIDASTETVNALQIEVEENTQRRNFTAAEIRDAAKRLEAAGYEKLRGRPRLGQKSLKRELASVFRLSENRIQHILNEHDEKGGRTPTFSAEKVIHTLEKWANELAKSEDPKLFQAKQQMESLMELLRESSVKDV